MSQLEYDVIEFLLHNREALIEQIKPEIQQNLKQVDESPSGFIRQQCFLAYLGNIESLLKMAIREEFRQYDYDELEIAFDPNNLNKIDFYNIFFNRKLYE